MDNDKIRPCDGCGGPLNGGNGGVLAGARVTFQRLAVNQRNARNELGMMQMFPGLPGIQRVFSTGDILDEPDQLYDEALLCEKCICTPICPLEIAGMRERAKERSEGSAAP